MNNSIAIFLKFKMDKMNLKQALTGHEGEVNFCDFGPRDRILGPML